MNAHNTFDRADAVRSVAYTGAQLKSGGFTALLPAMSVVVLDLK